MFGRHNTSVKIAGMSPEGFAAAWGGMNDKLPPFKRGDGMAFYNFSSEAQLRDTAYLAHFYGAIERAILAIKAKPGDFAPTDLRNMNKLLAHVRSIEPEKELPADFDGILNCILDGTIANDDQFRQAVANVYADGRSPTDVEYNAQLLNVLLNKHGDLTAAKERHEETLGEFVKLCR